MIVRVFLAGVLIVIVCACGSEKRESAGAATDSIPESVSLAEDSITTDQISKVDSGIFYKTDSTLFGPDSLFNFLAREFILGGEFYQAVLVTDYFIDVAQPGKNNLSVYLVQSGEGEYSGMREDIPFEEVYSALVVVRSDEAETEIVAQEKLETGGGHGLISIICSAEPILLSPDQYGVLVHVTSSEEGAGDSGYTIDDAALYVLNNGELTNVLEFKVEDSFFSSDEQGSYYEQEIITEFIVHDNLTKGLYDIQLVVTKTTSGSEETEEITAEDESNEVDGGDGMYQWNGTQYTLVGG